MSPEVLLELDYFKTEKAVADQKSRLYMNNPAFVKLLAQDLESEPHREAVLVDGSVERTYFPRRKPAVASDGKESKRGGSAARPTVELAGAGAGGAGFGLPLSFPLNRAHKLTYWPTGLLRKHVVEPCVRESVPGAILDAKLSGHRKDIVLLVRHPRGYQRGLRKQRRRRPQRKAGGGTGSRPGSRQGGVAAEGEEEDTGPFMAEPELPIGIGEGSAFCEISMLSLVEDPDGESGLACGQGQS